MSLFRKAKREPKIDFFFYVVSTYSTCFWQDWLHCRRLDGEAKHNIVCLEKPGKCHYLPAETVFYIPLHIGYICPALQSTLFVYSEKATKFCEISTLLLSAFTVDKSKVEISQNFVAFSEYMNFMQGIDNSFYLPTTIWCWMI